MTTPNNDEVRFDILIEAKAALKSLQELLRGTEDNRQKILLFTQTVVAQSKLWGVSWQQALNVYKQLNAELSKSHKPNLFGNTGGQDLMGMSEQYLQAADSANRLTDNTHKAGRAADDFGQKTESATRRAVRGIDAVRIATGALVAMLIFNVINAIQSTFRQAIDLAKQYEDTLYRLRNVEQSLSLSGIEISMKGLKQGIVDIQKLLPIFSKEDVSQLVGTLAISTKQLGLNEQQILDLAKAIGILNIRSEKQEDLSTTAQHVLSSILTGNAKGITSLGIAFTENVMKAKAMELGFLEAGEALANLSENEKGITKLNIILESTGTELANVGDYLDSNSAKLQENKAAWNDLLATFGQALLPFIPVLTGFFQFITDGLNAGKVAIIEFMTLLGTFGVVMTAVFTGQITNIGQFTKLVKTSMDTLREAMVNKMFSEVPENAPEWFKEGWGDLIKEEAETATSGVNEFNEAAKELDTSALEKAREIFEDTAYAVQDLAEKMIQKIEDLNTEYARKRADAEIDYLRKVDDINRDFERDLAKLKSKHRQEDERAERDYQQKLWELRMRYLMDLEDALHARDARQVIRLQKQYKLDKEALRRRHELESEEREQSQRAEQEELEQRRQQRLEEARIEYEQKLADLNLAKQREQEDLAKWYMREFEDLKQAQERKITQLVEGWAREQQITEANAAQVYAILQRYFGPGGLTDRLWQYMMENMLRATQLPPLPVIPPAPNEPPPESPPPPEPEPEPEIPPMHHQRMLPIGPKKYENINRTGVPINRLQNNVGPLGNRNKDGTKGSLTLEVLLSPELEARIIRKSLDDVGDVILKVVNSK